MFVWRNLTSILLYNLQLRVELIFVEIKAKYLIIVIYTLATPGTQKKVFYMAKKVITFLKTFGMLTLFFQSILIS